MVIYLMEDDWSNFLEPYDQAVNELKLKLRTLRGQFKKAATAVQLNMSPAESNQYQVF